MSASMALIKRILVIMFASALSGRTKLVEVPTIPGRTLVTQDQGLGRMFRRSNLSSSIIHFESIGGVNVSEPNTKASA